MSDFVREVDEEVRRDQFERFMKRYGGLLFALVVVALAAIGGWRYWRAQQVEKADVAGARFEDALVLARGGKTAEAEPTFDDLAATGPSGYRTLARFRAAAGLTPQDAAVRAWDVLASDSSLGATLQDLAKIRAGLLLVDTATPGEMSSRVETLAAPGQTWRNAARELMGLAAYRAGDYDAAGRWFDQIFVDPAAPQGARTRAQLMLELVRSGPVTVTPAAKG